MIEEEDYNYDERWPLWMRDWVLPYIQESVLWPVLFAIAAHFSVIYALMMVSVHRGGWDGAWGWLLFSVLSSNAPVAWEFSLFKRPGPIAVVVALTWAGAVFIAWGGLKQGLL